MVFLLLSCQSSSEKQDSVDPASCCIESKNQFLLESGSDTITILHTDTCVMHDADRDLKRNMSLIPAGEFMMGASEEVMALGREFPQHLVKVDSFYMDVHEVTNAQFAQFVNETDYLTVAELPIDWTEFKKQLPSGTPEPTEEALQPGSMVFTPSEEIFNYIDYSQWWTWVRGADWKHPEGPYSNIKDQGQSPVVHICYDDALAYAEWSGLRLPTEAEWEWAARGGLNDKIYPWGDQPVEQGEPKCNFWTGVFPFKNTKQDGYLGVAPVMQYEPNGYGLHDMAGNVWEICSDWYDERYYDTLAESQITDNPKGPKTWHYPLEPYDPKRVIRGGSFLCNDSYCSSYRVSARMPYSASTGMNHTGFRCVKEFLNLKK